MILMEIFEETAMSRPARALWIEIMYPSSPSNTLMSRPARALWIEISLRQHQRQLDRGRGPRGPCGLKWIRPCAQREGSRSRPARALWIEIHKLAEVQSHSQVEAREGLVD